MLCVAGEEFNYFRATNYMQRLDTDGKKAYAKKLWQEHPYDYYKWKEWCIESSMGPDFFWHRRYSYSNW